VKFVGAIGDKPGADVGAEAAKHFGTDDKAVSALRLTVAGGQTLKVKATLNVRYIPKLFTVMLGARSEMEFKQVNPGK
jgi:hypothetical protein